MRIFSSFVHQLDIWYNASFDMVNIDYWHICTHFGIADTGMFSYIFDILFADI